MPLYEFVCQDCEHPQELLIHGEKEPQCESCGSEKLHKLLSLPAAHSSSRGPDIPPPPGPCSSSCGCFPH